MLDSGRGQRLVTQVCHNLSIPLLAALTQFHTDEEIHQLLVHKTLFHAVVSYAPWQLFALYCVLSRIAEEFNLGEIVIMVEPLTIDLPISDALSPYIAEIETHYGATLHLK